MTISGETAGQYQNKDQIKKEIGNIDWSSIELIRMDSYSDAEVGSSIAKTNKIKELFAATIQNAVVGFGNQTYGAVQVDNKVIQIEQLYKECGVKIKLSLNTVLAPGDLTPRRLQRYFRYEIKDFIEEKNLTSYLWRKYSSHNDKYKSITFPGAEHLVEDHGEILYLLEAYSHLSELTQTKIVDRIVRVLIARGFYFIEEFFKPNLQK